MKDPLVHMSVRSSVCKEVRLGPSLGECIKTLLLSVRDNFAFVLVDPGQHEETNTVVAKTIHMWNPYATRGNGS